MALNWRPLATPQPCSRSENYGARGFVLRPENNGPGHCSGTNIRAVWNGMNSRSLTARRNFSSSTSGLPRTAQRFATAGLVLQEPCFLTFALMECGGAAFFVSSVTPNSTLGPGETCCRCL